MPLGPMLRGAELELGGVGEKSLKYIAFSRSRLNLFCSSIATHKKSNPLGMYFPLVI